MADVYLQVHMSDKLVDQVWQELKSRAEPGKDVVLARFFKTGPGQYGEGDKFLGVKVPQIRTMAKNLARTASLHDLSQLLAHAYHEVRLLAVITLVYQFARMSPEAKKQAFEFYLAHTDQINNWDLIDLSAPNIVGSYLWDNKSLLPILDQLSASSSLWERRIALLATFTFIRQKQFSHTLQLAEKLLADPHDLIQKAIGWMLREVGKRERAVLIKFLDQNVTQMSAVALSYSTEHLPTAQRKSYQHKRRLNKKSYAD